MTQVVTEPPAECQHEQHHEKHHHTGPVYALILRTFHCPADLPPIIWICRGGWENITRLRCAGGCGHIANKAESWTILRYAPGQDPLDLLDEDEGDDPF